MSTDTCTCSDLFLKKSALICDKTFTSQRLLLREGVLLCSLPRCAKHGHLSSDDQSITYQSVPLVAALLMDTSAPLVAPMSYPKRAPPKAGNRNAKPVMNQSIGCCSGLGSSPDSYNGVISRHNFMNGILPDRRVANIRSRR